MKDRIGARVDVLFVGINPGLRSALTGHHFAGYSNRFWKLLYEAGLVPEPLTYEQDDRLPDWGFGITNLISRPSAGIDELSREEYEAGARALRSKIRRVQPKLVALVGVTVHRALFPSRRSQPITLGLQEHTLGGVPVFVLPNPSGRNANYRYPEMLRAFRALARRVHARDV